MTAAEDIPNCPECGTPTTERGLPRPSGWAHPQRLVPLICVFALVVVLAVGFWNGRRSAGFGPVQNFGRSLEFVEPFLTVKDLHDIAQGRRDTGGALCRAVLGLSNDWLVRPPGREFMRLEFHPPDGVRTKTTSYGWPIPFVVLTRMSEMLDVTTRTPVPPADVASVWPIARVGPSSSVQFEGGRIITVRSNPRFALYRDMTVVNIIGMAGAMVIPITVGVMSAAIARVVLRRRDAKWRRGAEQRVGLAVGVLLALAMVVGVMAMPHRNETLATGAMSLSAAQRFAASARPGIASLARERVITVTYAQIVEMAKGPGADRRLAAAIIDGSELPVSTTSLYLSAGFIEDTVRGGSEFDFGAPWPLVSIDGVQRWYTAAIPLDPNIPFFGSSTGSPVSGDRVTWAPAPASWRVRGGQLQVAPARSAPTQELHAVMIDLSGVLFCVFLGWLVWALACFACARKARHTAARRVSANQCVRCGYSLEGVEAVIPTA